MAKPLLRKNIPFFPDLFVAEIMTTVIVLTVLFLATALGYSAPLEELADPFLTPPHSQAPWYFLFLQGLLKFTPKLVGAFLIPLVFLTLLFLLPYIDRGKTTLRRKRIITVLVLIFGVTLAVLTYLGTPAFGID